LGAFFENFLKTKLHSCWLAWLHGCMAAWLMAA
jgi:hypothetical protein